MAAPRAGATTRRFGLLTGCRGGRAGATLHVSSTPPPPERRSPMTNALRRLGRALSGLAAEDRPAFKRVDASPARYDDGSWL